MEQDAKKKIQEKILIFQILQGQLEELSNQATLAGAKMAEIEEAQSVLRDVKGIPANNDALIPIGAGCFAHGKMAGSDKFLVEVGAGYMMNRSPEEALALLEEKKKEIEKVGEKINAEMERLATYINKLGLDIQKLGAAGEENTGSAGNGKKDDDQDGGAITVGDDEDQ